MTTPTATKAISGFDTRDYSNFWNCHATRSRHYRRSGVQAKRYPMKDKSPILADLIATTPGEEGKWFATAKEFKLYELAL